MRIKDPGDKPAACERCKRSTLDFDFTFAYQPIVNVRTRLIVAHEALARGLAGESAGHVLSQVDEGNRYGFDQLCRVKAIEGAAKLGMKERLSINFLPNAVDQPEACIQKTLAAAKRCRFPLSQIIFEVTEGEESRDRGRLVDIFRAYRQHGFQTAIDDFGAGYSGLGLLAAFQPDLLKIDMALIRGIHLDVAKQVIVDSILSMCRRLDVDVLAEGVESSEERDCLIDAGIDLMQGFLFCRPRFQGVGDIAPSSWGAAI